MTIEQLRSVHRERPFRPFTLHQADGRAITVVHNEFMSFSPSGRTVIVNNLDDSFEIVDLLLVTSVEVHGAASNRVEGN